jgi:hypothetical protein
MIHIDRKQIIEKEPYNWASSLTSELPSHVVRLSLSFDYTLENDPHRFTGIDLPKKYYITYSLGGHVEGKVCTTNADRFFTKWYPKMVDESRSDYIAGM